MDIRVKVFIGLKSVQEVLSYFLTLGGEPLSVMSEKSSELFFNTRRRAPFCYE